MAKRRKQRDPFVIMPVSLIRRTDLDAGAKVLWAVLADYARMDGTDAAWPGQRRLREDMGVGGWRLQGWIDQLTAVGALQIERGTGRRSNRYTPVDPAGSALHTGAQTPSVAPRPDGALASRSAQPTGALETRSAPPHRAQERRSAPVAPRPLPGITRENQKTKNTSLEEKCATGRLRGPVVSSTRKPRPQNLLWDAVCETFNLDPKTKAQCARVGKRKEEFRELGATPEEIQTRAQRHRTAWPECECSPESLLKWWERFGKPIGSSLMPPPKKGVDEL